MSNKGKPSVREAEIEKCREEANWKRIIDLAEQVKQRTPSSGEMYTDTHPPQLEQTQTHA